MQLNVSDVTVEVIRKDIKNMHLRVRPPDGRVVLSAPHSVGNATIDGFIASRRGFAGSVSTLPRRNVKHSAKA